MAQPKSIHAFGFLVILGCAAAVATAEATRELPVHLQNHLVRRGSAVMARYDWQAMRGLPPVHRLLEADLKDLKRPMMVVGPAVKIARVLDVDEGVIEEIWVAMMDPAGSSRDAAWVATSLDKEELESRFMAPDWVRCPGQQGVFARAEDLDFVSEDKAALDDMPEAEREVALSRMLRTAYRIAVMEDGWLYVAPPFASVPWDVRHPRKREYQEAEEKPVLEFPFDGLAELDAPLICVMAVDTPGNDGGGKNEEEDNGNSLEAMHGRLRALKGLPENTVVGELGDFLLSFSEVDGGIAIDVLARRDDGGGERATESFLEFMVLIMRLGVTYAGPALAQELGEAQLTASHGEVRGQVVISLASVEDALDVELERRREIRELTDLVNEMELDIERQRAVDGS